MPAYEVEYGGHTYRVDAPEEATQAQLEAAFYDYLQDTDENLLEKIPVVGPAVAGMADTALGVTRGTVTAASMTADAFGADNPVTQSLDGVNTFLGGLMSSASKADAIEQGRIRKAAEDGSIAEQAAAGWEAIKVAPIDFAAQFAGSAVPFVAAAAATGGGALAPALLAGVQGLGIAKGSIYDTVKEEAEKEGVPEEEAKMYASALQSYGGENLDMIAVSGVIGAIAGSTGVTRSPVAQRLVAKVAAALGAKGMLQKTAPVVAGDIVKRGLGKRVVTAGLEEGVPEAVQAFHEVFSGNLGAQRGGFDVPLTRGAWTQAVEEGLGGAFFGGGLGAMNTSTQGSVTGEIEEPPGKKVPGLGTETYGTPPAELAEELGPQYTERYWQHFAQAQDLDASPDISDEFARSRLAQEFNLGGAGDGTAASEQPYNGGAGTGDSTAGQPGTDDRAAPAPPPTDPAPDTGPDAGGLAADRGTIRPPAVEPAEVYDTLEATPAEVVQAAKDVREAFEANVSDFEDSFGLSELTPTQLTMAIADRLADNTVDPYDLITAQLQNEAAGTILPPAYDAASNFLKRATPAIMEEAAALDVPSTQVTPPAQVAPPVVTPPAQVASRWGLTPPAQVAPPVVTPPAQVAPPVVTPPAQVAPPVVTPPAPLDVPPTQLSPADPVGVVQPTPELESEQQLMAELDLLSALNTRVQGTDSSMEVVFDPDADLSRPWLYRKIGKRTIHKFPTFAKLSERIGGLKKYQNARLAPSAEAAVGSVDTTPTAAIPLVETNTPGVTQLPAGNARGLDNTQTAGTKARDTSGTAPRVMRGAQRRRKGAPQQTLSEGLKARQGAYAEAEAATDRNAPDRISSAEFAEVKDVLDAPWTEAQFEDFVEGKETVYGLTTDPKWQNVATAQREVDRANIALQELANRRKETVQGLEGEGKADVEAKFDKGKKELVAARAARQQTLDAHEVALATTAKTKLAKLQRTRRTKKAKLDRDITKQEIEQLKLGKDGKAAKTPAARAQVAARLAATKAKLRQLRIDRRENIVSEHRDPNTGDPSPLHSAKFEADLEGRSFDAAVKWAIDNAPTTDAQELARSVGRAVSAMKEKGWKFNFEINHEGEAAPDAAKDPFVNNMDLLRQRMAQSPGKTPTEALLDMMRDELADLSEAELLEDANPTPYEPDYETIRANPGMNAKRMAKMLGPQLYGDPTNMSEVVVKEVLQNAFDATRTAVRSGQIAEGHIDLSVSQDQRTLTITDNGVGMTPDILGNKFLQIAGTGKEGANDSGGFGIAKMLFLYANKRVTVTTARDGRVARMDVTGAQLFDALDDPQFAPDIEVTDYGTIADQDILPEGHGTVISLTVPETSGEYEINPFPSYLDSLPAVNNSPLFNNIELTTTSASNYSETVPVGKNFPMEEYTQFVGVQFPWGTAKVYVTREPTGPKYGDNMHILSNGLWQFSSRISKKPMEMYSDPVPYTFYVDLVPAVKPDETGYPFHFNRQGFTDTAKEDFSKVKDYINAIYSYKTVAGDATNFGNIRYFSDTGALGSPIDLTPQIPTQDTAFTRMSKGDQITVSEDGSLLINGNHVPELTPDQLKAGVPDLMKLLVGNDIISPDSVMVHDNVDVIVKDTGEKLSIHDFMRNKFGAHFDEFLHYTGSSFLQLRDIVADLMDYPTLKTEGVGISMDPEYRGVSIKVPFNGSFVNPLAPRYPDGLRAGYGIFGTMVHELAHHKVRGHDAAFPAEFQKLELHLEALSGKAYRDAKQGFAETVATDYADIVKFGWEMFYDKSADIEIKYRGNRFTDGSREQASEGAGRSGAGDVRGPSGDGAAGESLLGPAQEGVGAVGGRDERETGAGRDESTDATGARGRSILNPEDKTVSVSVNGADMVGQAGTSWETLFHELVHSVTQAGVAGNHPRTKELKAVLKEVRAGLDRAAEGTEGLANTNVIDDSHELLAWALSSPDVQAALENMPSTGRQTLWGRIKDGIRKFLRLGPKYKNAFEQVLDAAETIMAGPLNHTGTSAEVVESLQENQRSQSKKYQAMARSVTGNDSVGFFQNLYKMATDRSYRDYVKVAKENRPYVGNAWFKRLIRALHTDGIRDIIKDTPIASNAEEILQQLDALGAMRIHLSVRLGDILAEYRAHTDTFTDHTVSKEDNADPRKTGYVMQYFSALMTTGHMSVDDISTKTQQQAVTTDPVVIKYTQLANDPAHAKNKTKFENIVRERKKQYAEAYILWDRLGKQGGGHKVYIRTRDAQRTLRDMQRLFFEQKVEHLANSEGQKSNLLDNVRLVMMQDPSAPVTKDTAHPMYEELHVAAVPWDYFPLHRKGNWSLRLTKSLKGYPGKHTWSFESKQERDAFLYEIAKEAKVDPHDARIFETSSTFAEPKFATDNLLMKDMLNAIDNLGPHASTADLQELKDNLYQLVLTSNPRAHFAPRNIHRKERAGYDIDFAAGVGNVFSDYSHQLPKLRYGYRLESSLDAATEKITNFRVNDEGIPSTETVEQFGTVINEIRERVHHELHPTQPAKWAVAMNRFAFFMFLSNAATAITQFTAIPIRVVPHLSRAFGVNNAVAIAAKYANPTNFGTFTYRNVRGKLRPKIPSIRDGSTIKGNPLLEEAYDYMAQKFAVFRVTGAQETMDTYMDPQRGGMKRGVKRFKEDVYRGMTSLFNASEQLSRESTAMMAFELKYDQLVRENKPTTSQEKRLLLEEAGNYAAETIKQTLGNYQSSNRPTLARGDLQRMAFLFKQYSLITTWFFAKSLYTIFKRGKYTPAQRWDAFKELSAVLMVGGAFHGLAGMPGFSMMAAVIDAVGLALFSMGDPDDEDEAMKRVRENPYTAFDSEYRFKYEWMRDNFGPANVEQDKNITSMADVLTYGPISTALGWNMGSRTSFNGLWFREGYGKGDGVFHPDNITSMFFANVPALSSVTNFTRGVNNLAQGNVLRGLEGVLPSGLKAMVTTHRLATEGGETYKEEDILPPEEFDTLELLGQLIGFQPTQLAKLQRLKSETEKSVRLLTGKRSKLTGEFNVALAEDDPERAMDALADIRQWNTRYWETPVQITEKDLYASWTSFIAQRKYNIHGVDLNKKIYPYFAETISETR
jgi:hypothetical protein